jgi:osmotically inducible lipoprotein OsmB
MTESSAMRLTSFTMESWRMRGALGFLTLCGAVLMLSACGHNVEQRAATGAAAGLIVGGPVGAAVGAGVGVVVDRTQRR